MERREFFKSLVAGGATVRKTKHRARGGHAGDVRLYRGPMTIPAHVAEMVREDPTPHRAIGRGSHLASRYSAGGWTWLFRCQIPASRQMVGEVIRKEHGGYRVHCWQTADPGAYRTPEELLANRRIPEDAPTPIMPPLVPAPQPTWMTEATDYSEYMDPTYAEKLLEY